VAGTEVVERDHAAEVAEVFDGSCESGVFRHDLFHHLDHDAARIDVRVLAQLGEKVAQIMLGTAAEHFRMNVQKQPAIVGIVSGMIVHVQIAAQLVEMAEVLIARGAGDDSTRGHRIAFVVAGPEQALVPDRAAMRQAEDGLEVTGEREAVITGRHAVCAMDDVGALARRSSSARADVAA
jgi:hypothetical protein